MITKEDRSIGQGKSADRGPIEPARPPKLTASPGVPAKKAEPAKPGSQLQDRGTGEADRAALKQACSQAMDLLALARAKSSDPIPMLVAAATLASSVKPSANEVNVVARGVPAAVSSPAEEDEPAIKGLRLCRKVSGLGAFEPIEASRLKAGQPALLYCEPTGLRFERKDGVFVARLSSRVELVSVASGSRVWDLSLGEARDESPGRRDASYVNYRMTFPRSIAPGDYLLRLTQTDLAASKTASSELPVTFIR